MRATPQPKPRIPAENRLAKALVESGLESGLTHSDAVRLAIGVYKEIDVLARDERSTMLTRAALKDIRGYACAIMRSGTTFKAFEIATRAVATWRLVSSELKELHDEWNREEVSKRLRQRQLRQERAARAKLHANGVNV